MSDEHLNLQRAVRAQEGLSRRPWRITLGDRDTGWQVVDADGRVLAVFTRNTTERDREFVNTALDRFCTTPYCRCEE